MDNDSMDLLLDMVLDMLKGQAKGSPFRVSAELNEGSDTVRTAVQGSAIGIVVGATAIVASVCKQFKGNPVLMALLRVMINSALNGNFDDAKSSGEHVAQTPQGVADDNAMSSDLLTALLGKKKP